MTIEEKYPPPAPSLKKGGGMYTDSPSEQTPPCIQGGAGVGT